MIETEAEKLQINGPFVLEHLTKYAEAIKNLKQTDNSGTADAIRAMCAILDEEAAETLRAMLKDEFER